MIENDLTENKTNGNLAFNLWMNLDREGRNKKILMIMIALLLWKINKMTISKLFSFNIN